MIKPWPFKPGTLDDIIRQLGDLSRRISDRTVTLPVNFTGAPSVAGCSVVRTANTGATSLTGFLGGYDTARLVVIAGDGNTTMVHSSSLYLKALANVTLVNKQTKNFVGSADPTTGAINWLEI